MNLTLIIQTNDCLISVDPLKMFNLFCLLKVEKILFEKAATDSTVLSGSLSKNIVFLKDVIASSSPKNG